ncbi:hypothetical protein [Pseudonocardia nigra]|uniref:hypothetical protein n=1 Tax=Pseudonocardia nigra TaxID=1921578 RepID=UPI001C5F9A92|nr:hypothetical protein [Pseudonocardia nigra]
MHPGDHITRLLSATACSGDGRPIGPVTAVYVDDDSGNPVWVTVRPGPPGTAERFVPLARAWLHPGSRLVLSVTRAAVEAAPVPPSGELGSSDEDELYRYYAQAITPIGRRPAEAAALTGAGPVRLRRRTLSDAVDPHLGLTAS